MKVSALIMGICPPVRLIWLKDTLDYMDAQKFPFHHKVLAIDEYGGHIFPEEFKEEFEERGWTVVKDSHKNRIKSMYHALQYTDSDIVFYNEDDVKATLPKYEVVKTMFDEGLVVDEYRRECGILSMALGGTHMDQSKNDLGDIAFMEENRITESILGSIDSDILIFTREEKLRNAWFFEFPGLFVRSDILKSCMDYASEHFPGQQVEQGLTSAYFAQEFNTKYFKCSIARPEAPAILREDPFKLNSHCRFLENLDPRQGQSPLGGCHSF